MEAKIFWTSTSVLSLSIVRDMQQLTYRVFDSPFPMCAIRKLSACTRVPRESNSMGEPLSFNAGFRSQWRFCGRRSFSPNGELNQGPRVQGPMRYPLRYRWRRLFSTKLHSLWGMRVQVESLLIAHAGKPRVKDSVGCSAPLLTAILSWR